MTGRLVWGQRDTDRDGSSTEERTGSEIRVERRSVYSTGTPPTLTLLYADTRFISLVLVLHELRILSKPTLFFFSPLVARPICYSRTGYHIGPRSPEV
eukprot:3750589-Rhodomonas_salina.2